MLSQHHPSLPGHDILDILVGGGDAWPLPGLVGLTGRGACAETSIHTTTLIQGFDCPFRTTKLQPRHHLKGWVLFITTPDVFRPGIHDPTAFHESTFYFILIPRRLPSPRKIHYWLTLVKHTTTPSVALPWATANTLQQVLSLDRAWPPVRFDRWAPRLAGATKLSRLRAMIHRTLSLEECRQCWLIS